MLILIENVLRIPPHEELLINLQFKEELTVKRVNFLLEYNYKLANSNNDHPELQGNFLWLCAKSIVKEILDSGEPRVVFLLSEFAVQHALISLLHEANVECFVYSPRFKSFVQVHNPL